MAEAVPGLCFETDLIADAARDLALIASRIRQRHGAPFRALEHRLVRLAEGGLTQGFPLQELEPGRYVMTPSAELRDLVDDARRLGVI